MKVEKKGKISYRYLIEQWFVIAAQDFLFKEVLRTFPQRMIAQVRSAPAPQRLADAEGGQRGIQPRVCVVEPGFRNAGCAALCGFGVYCSGANHDQQHS